MITQENIPYTADEIKAMVKTCEKYNKAIERMKSWAKGEHPECFSEAQKTAEFIFPELKEKESKDERIRKEILNVFNQLDEGTTICGRNYDYAKWIAWLEKQGEKKPTDKKELKKVEQGNHPRIVMADFTGGEGFYKLNLDNLNKEQVNAIEIMINNPKPGKKIDADKVIEWLKPYSVIVDNIIEEFKKDFGL